MIGGQVTVDPAQAHITQIPIGHLTAFLDIFRKIYSLMICHNYSSVVEWESEIGPTGEVFYVESAEESLFEDPTVFNNKNDSPQPELTRRRSTRAGKLFRLIRRKESKRWSTRNKKINSSTVASNIGAQEKDANGSKEVTFRDFQVLIRDTLLL